MVISFTLLWFQMISFVDSTITKEVSISCNEIHKRRMQNNDNPFTPTWGGGSACFSINEILKTINELKYWHCDTNNIVQRGTLTNLRNLSWDQVPGRSHRLQLDPIGLISILIQYVRIKFHHKQTVFIKVNTDSDLSVAGNNLFQTLILSRLLNCTKYKPCIRQSELLACLHTKHSRSSEWCIR